MPTETTPEPSPPVNPPASASPPRGLPQASREQQINTAMWILIGVGILWLVINGILFAQSAKNVESIVQSKIDDVHRRGGEADPDSVIQLRAALRRYAYAVIGGSAALGAALILLGVVAKTFPVPCTVLGLLLCIAATAAYRYYTPEMTAWTWFWKILTILALIKAVHSAVTSPKDKKPPQKRAVFIPR
jgi:hypothetical protein